MENNEMKSVWSHYDFIELFNRVPFPAPPKRVIKAWDNGIEGKPGSDWSGGIVVELNDGRYAYFTGWCDYTGWG